MAETGGWRLASLASEWPAYNVATAVSAGFGAPADPTAPLEAAFAGLAGYRVWLRDGMDEAESALRGAGFELTVELPAYWRRLGRAWQPLVPAGYRVYRAESPEDVADAILGDRWGGFMEDAEAARTFPDPLAMAAEGERRFYVARDGDRLVATGQSHWMEGVVGIYGMWTADRHRRRGLATAILHLALAEAAGEGLEYATLQASELGIGIYERSGFRAYCRYRVYRPPAAIDRARTGGQT
ncbi:MAG: hypothetical protein QOE92_2396 [Chloroflexota bacterium]|nr:hypothetical protein [Chloroflexota bacterium]